jgi:hypothetical protein
MEIAWSRQRGSASAGLDKFPREKQSGKSLRLTQWPGSLQRMAMNIKTNKATAVSNAPKKAPSITRNKGEAWSHVDVRSGLTFD